MVLFVTQQVKNEAAEMCLIQGEIWRLGGRKKCTVALKDALKGVKLAAGLPSESKSNLFLFFWCCVIPPWLGGCRRFNPLLQVLVSKRAQNMFSSKRQQTERAKRLSLSPSSPVSGRKEFAKP